MKTGIWNGWNKAAAMQVAHHFPKEVERVLDTAKDICNHTFVFREHWDMERTNEAVCFLGEIDWVKAPGDDQEWVYAFNRHNFLVNLGMAYLFTGDTKYVDASAKLVEDWIERVPLSKETENTAWRAIETGLRCESWLRACSMMQDVMAESTMKKMEDSLAIHGQRLMDCHGPFQRLSNWGVLQNHGLFLLGLSLEKPEWCETAIERLAEAVEVQILPDGSHWEQSPMYHGEVLHCLLGVVSAATHMNYVLPENFLLRTKEMAFALGIWSRPDGKLLCQSDSDEIDARDLLTEAAYLFQDERLVELSRGKCFPQTFWEFGEIDTKILNSDHKWRRKSAALSASGNYMLLDGETEDAGMLHFHCGHLGSGHGHGDLLHVDLVTRGETILADSGRYTYVEGETRKQLKSPSAHNVLLVDGQDFTVYKNTWDYSVIAEPLKGEYCFLDKIDYVSGAHLGYKDVFHRRKVLRLSKDLWVIWDECHGRDDKVHNYTRRFHFGVGMEAKLEKDGVTVQSKNASGRFIFPKENKHMELFETKASREYNMLETISGVHVENQGSKITGLVTVIATGKEIPKCKVSMVPVSLAKAGTLLREDQAEGILIETENKQWMVLNCYTEIISEVDLFQVNDCYGYGKVIVFEDGKARPVAF
ncbi:heparinase II/III family protein [Lachnospiraceae bacterium OttesenSCG-928-D06]|nr:heparinase II/III family protein [Lachnospiraceae bacterium OttesenSCG-928-D06]